MFTNRIVLDITNGMDNFRNFLRTEIENRKKKNSQFSLRSFARWLEISPAQLSQLISGKRNFNFKTVSHISLKLGLTPIELNTILGDALTKHQIMHNSVAQNLQSKVLYSDDEFRVMADWYHVAILNLSRMKNAKADPRWIARKLNISVEIANVALQRLVKLGLIQVKPEFKQLKGLFEVSSQIPSSSIQKYHKQMLNLAEVKIEEVDLKLRDFQSLILNLNKEDIAKYKKIIAKFYDDLETLATHKNGQEVYTINLQFFPLTNLKGD